MVLWLKYFYQTLSIQLNLLFYAVTDKKYNQQSLVINRLARKNFRWSPGRPTKVFAVFVVNNWEYVLLDPLRGMGELHHFTWSGGKYFFDNREEWQTFHDQLNADMLRAFDDMYDENANIVVFIYASDFSVGTKTLRAMQRSNTLVVSFCWDDLLYFKGSVKGQPVGVSQLSKYADINLTFSPQAIPRYNHSASPCFFWRGLAVDMPVGEELLPVSYQKFYVLFIGSAYGWRKKFIDELKGRGINIVCYGEGWENGVVDDAAMKKLIREAPLTLGFSNVGYTRNITTIKGRVFEVPLFGGLLITQAAPGLDEYFEHGKEVLVFNDMDECYEQIKFVADNPIESQWIRKEGHKKMLTSGTWNARFAYLGKLIEQATNYNQKSQITEQI